jgi:hypothetical protein
VAITDLKIGTFRTPGELADFVKTGGIPATVITGGNVFPMAALPAKTLTLAFSTDGGSTYPGGSDRSHVFGAGPFATIDDVVADIVADAPFMGAAPADLIYVFALVDELVIKTVVSGNRALKVKIASTAIGAGLLQYLGDQVGNGSITTIQQILTDASGQYVIYFR